MRNILKRMGALLPGIGDRKRFERTAAPSPTETERDLSLAREMLDVKAQELRYAWEHAHKLDKALQQLDVLYRSTAEHVSASRNDAILAHTYGSEKPTVPSLIVPDLPPSDRDVRIAERLLKAYHRAAAEESARRSAASGDSWAWIKTLQGEFFDALERKDPHYLAEYLGAMGRRDATIGIDQGNIEFEKLTNDPGKRDQMALHHKDKLLSLAEAVGAFPCENPEQGVWGKGLHTQTDVLVECIERTLGIDISPPAIDGGLLKISSSRALFCERDCSALYTAWSIRQILAKQSEVSVCEIGAGSGRVAYWSHRFGPTRYTIYDLPHINVVHGNYLLRSLPEDQVVLYGEPNASPASAPTTILPYFCMEKTPSRSFDLIFNQDSFPEIQSEIVTGYLNWIKRASRGLLYSLNHESRPLTIGGDSLQVNVPELIDKVGGFRRLSRSPYWLRRGYVAELYTILDQAG